MKENVLYQRTLVPASESEDGDSPTRIVLTQEVNGYAIHLESFEVNGLLAWEKYSRDAAIETAVYLMTTFPPEKLETMCWTGWWGGRKS